MSINGLLDIAGLRYGQDRLSQEKRFSQQLVARRGDHCMTLGQIPKKKPLVDRAELELPVLGLAAKPVNPRPPAGNVECIDQPWNGSPHVDQEVP